MSVLSFMWSHVTVSATALAALLAASWAWTFKSLPSATPAVINNKPLDRSQARAFVQRMAEMQRAGTASTTTGAAADSPAAQPPAASRSPEALQPLDTNPTKKRLVLKKKRRRVRRL